MLISVYQNIQYPSIEKWIFFRQGWHILQHFGMFFTEISNSLELRTKIVFYSANHTRWVLVENEKYFLPIGRHFLDKISPVSKSFAEIRRCHHNSELYLLKNSDIWVQDHARIWKIPYIIALTMRYLNLDSGVEFYCVSKLYFYFLDAFDNTRQKSARFTFSTPINVHCRYSILTNAKFSHLHVLYTLKFLICCLNWWWN